MAGLHADLREGDQLMAPHPILCRMRRFCVWLKLEAVAQIEVIEWTGVDHPRHTKFVTLRDDPVFIPVTSFATAKYLRVRKCCALYSRLHIVGKPHQNLRELRMQRGQSCELEFSGFCHS
jgi:hypothetical protein